MTGNLQISNWDTLTIESGVKVNLQYYTLIVGNNGSSQPGVLEANGVTFSSISNDGTLDFQYTSTGTVSNCSFTSANLKFENTSAPSVTGNTFDVNSPVYLYSEMVIPELSSNTFGSETFYISLSLNKSTTLKNFGNCTYVLTGNLQISNWDILTIESGVKVNLQYYTLIVGNNGSSQPGVLEANGVAFSSISNLGTLDFQDSSTAQLLGCNFAQMQIKGENNSNVIINTSNFDLSCSVTNSSSVPMNAENNYWGDPSGPKNSANPQGTGATVGNKVDFNPFSASPDPFPPIIPTVTNWTFSLPVAYQGTIYTIFFKADSASYKTLQSQYSNPMAPQAAYLYTYLVAHLPSHNTNNYQITGDSIYIGDQPVTSPPLRGEIMKTALLWGYYYFYYSDYGGANALSADSAQWGELYSNQWKQQIGAALAQVVDLATIVGPLASDLTSLFSLNSSESEQIQNFITLIDDIAGGVQELQAAFPSTWPQIVAAIPGNNGGTYDSLSFILGANAFPNPGQLATQLYNAAYPNSPMSQSDTSAAVKVLSALGTDVLQNAEVSSLQAGASFAISYFGYGLSATTASQIATSTAFQGISSFATPLSIASFIVQNFVMPQAQLLQQEVNIQTCLMTTLFPKLMDLLDSMVVQNNANGDAGIDVANLMGLKSVYQSLWFTTDINLVGIEWLNPNGQYTAQSDSFEAMAYASAAQNAYDLEEAAEAQSVTLTPVIERPSSVPTVFTLYQNYPNPFNPTTTIIFSLKENSKVELDIFTILGQRVQNFDLGQMNAGTHAQIVDMSRYASGVYFYRMQAGAYSASKKFVLLK